MLPKTIYNLLGLDISSLILRCCSRRPCYLVMSCARAAKAWAENLQKNGGRQSAADCGGLNSGMEGGKHPSEDFSSRVYFRSSGSFMGTYGEGGGLGWPPSRTIVNSTIVGNHKKCSQYCNHLSVNTIFYVGQIWVLTFRNFKFRNIKLKSKINNNSEVMYSDVKINILNPWENNLKVLSRRLFCTDNY